MSGAHRALPQAAHEQIQLERHGRRWVAPQHALAPAAWRHRPRAIFIAAAAAAAAAVLHVSPAAALAGPSLSNAAGFAGLWPALATVITSELGDKTFFVAMILGMRRGRTLALTSSLTALYAMTVISTILGVVVKSFPAVLQGGESAVSILGAFLFAFFGITTLLQARTARQTAMEEKAEATEEVSETLQVKTGRWREWWQCVILVFVAEWGDRSMLAQVALAATWGPIGVIIGGMAGHTFATVCAVYGGEVLNNYIDDVTAKIIGGVLFLCFSATTLIGVY